MSLFRRHDRNVTIPPSARTSRNGRSDYANFECEPETRPRTDSNQTDANRSGAPFLSILAYAHLVEAWRPAQARLSRIWPSAKLFLRVSPWRRFIRRACRVRTYVCVAARCYTFRQCYQFAYEFVQRPRIRYCCIQSRVLSLSLIHPCRTYHHRLSEGGKVEPYLDEH